MPKQHWKEIAGLAGAPLQGQPPLFDPTPEIRAAAEDIVAKLRAREFRADALARESSGGESSRGRYGKRGHDPDLPKTARSQSSPSLSSD